MEGNSLELQYLAIKVIVLFTDIVFRRKFIENLLIGALFIQVLFIEIHIHYKLYFLVRLATYTQTLVILFAYPTQCTASANSIPAPLCVWMHVLCTFAQMASTSVQQKCSGKPDIVYTLWMAVSSDESPSVCARSTSHSTSFSNRERSVLHDREQSLFHRVTAPCLHSSK